MIRIVGVQRNHCPDREFVLLQNQGGMRLNLRGHVVLSEAALNSGNLCREAHAFGDDTNVPPGCYVLLFSGEGNPRWARTKDGALVYYAYMNREAPVWESVAGPMHVLATQHTYTERAVEAVYMR